MHIVRIVVWRRVIQKRRRFVAPLLARLLVLWKSFVVAWLRQLFCSLPRSRFRKPVGAPVLARLR